MLLKNTLFVGSKSSALVFNPQYPTSHPDCNLRDTIFLASSQLYTCTLHSTTTSPHLIPYRLYIADWYLFLCLQTSRSCRCLKWHIGFLLCIFLGVDGRRNQTVFDGKCVFHQLIVIIYERKLSEQRHLGRSLFLFVCIDGKGCLSTVRFDTL